MCSMEIKPTGNSKTRAYKGQKNTFGFLPGNGMWHNEIRGTCPGATTGENGCWGIKAGRKCATCYVAGIIAAYPGVYPVLKHNTEMAWNEDAFMALTNEFFRFKAAERKRQEAGKTWSLNYRIHWSGDCPDESYVDALYSAMALHKDITFWMYTRSMFAVELLSKLPNIRLYISLDPENFDEGMSTYTEHKNNDNLRVCYMSPVNDFTERLARYAVKFVGQNAVREMIGAKHKPASLLDIKPVACPADAGKADTDGCCHKCRMCFADKEKHIWFKS